MDPLAVSIKKVFGDDNGYLFITTDNHVFIELIGTNDIDNSMIDITADIPLNDTEFVEVVVLSDRLIYLHTSEDRLFYVERFPHISSYQEDGITVHFIAENVISVVTSFYDAYILSYSNNVYRHKKGTEGTYSLEQEDLSGFIPDTITDMLGLDYNLYMVTDQEEIYHCTTLDMISHTISEDIVDCDVLQSEVPYELLYDALSTPFRDIYYGKDAYYINTSDVYTIDSYSSPLNRTEELLYSFHYYYGTLITDEHIYMYDVGTGDFVDVLDLIPLEDGEHIIDIAVLNNDEIEYVLFRSDLNRVYISNETSGHHYSDITEFTDITDQLYVGNESIEAFNTFSSMGLDTTVFTIMILLDNGTTIDITFNENLLEQDVDYIRPTTVMVDTFTFTYLDDLEDVFGSTYEEAQLYLDQEYTLNVDFEVMIESPYDYDVLFHHSTD
jgi:hypothetical protein